MRKKGRERKREVGRVREGVRGKEGGKREGDRKERKRKWEVKRCGDQMDKNQ